MARSKEGQALKYHIEIEWYFDEPSDEYVELRSDKTIESELDWLSSGFDLFHFETKADRTKFLRRLRKIGVPEEAILLSKQVVG